MVISQDGRVLVLHKVSSSQAGRYFSRAGSETQAFQLTVLEKVQETVHFVSGSGSVRLYFRVLTSPSAVSWCVKYSVFCLCPYNTSTKIFGT